MYRVVENYIKTKGKIMNKPNSKMPISKRAKQFMPFSALSGLSAALAEKEIEIEKAYEKTYEKTYKKTQDIHMQDEDDKIDYPF